MGYAQGDAIRNITGYGGYAEHSLHIRSGDAGGAFYYSGANNHLGSGSTDRDNQQLNFDASYVVPTANENRPINKAVRYLIRAKF